MSDDKTEPRAWWIETRELLRGDHDRQSRDWPQVYETNIPNTIHVIEHSAYLEMKDRAEKAEADLAEFKKDCAYIHEIDEQQLDSAKAAIGHLREAVRKMKGAMWCENIDTQNEAYEAAEHALDATSGYDETLTKE